MSEGNVPYRAYFELGTKKMPLVFVDDEAYGKPLQSLIIVATERSVKEVLVSRNLIGQEWWTRMWSYPS